MIELFLTVLLVSFYFYPDTATSQPSCTDTGISISMGVTFNEGTLALQAHERETVYYSVLKVSLEAPNSCPITDGTVSVRLPNSQTKTIATSVNLGGSYPTAASFSTRVSYAINPRDVITVGSFSVVRAEATITAIRHMPSGTGLDIQGPVTASTTIDTIILKTTYQCRCNINIPKNWHIPGWPCFNIRR